MWDVLIQYGLPAVIIALAVSLASRAVFNTYFRAKELHIERLAQMCRQEQKRKEVGDA